MQFWSFGLMQQIKAHHLVKSLPKSLVKWETDAKKLEPPKPKLPSLITDKIFVLTISYSFSNLRTHEIIYLGFEVTIVLVGLTLFNKVWDVLYSMI